MDNQFKNELIFSIRTHFAMIQLNGVFFDIQFYLQTDNDSLKQFTIIQNQQPY